MTTTTSSRQPTVPTSLIWSEKRGRVAATQLTEREAIAFEGQEQSCSKNILVTEFKGVAEQLGLQG